MLARLEPIASFLEGYLAASALVVWRGCTHGSYTVSAKLVNFPFSRAKGGGTRYLGGSGGMPPQKIFEL